MSELLNYFYLFLMFVGLFFLITAAIGVVKFKDVYARLHAASKGGTFGFAFIVLGAALMHGELATLTKALLAIAFQFMTAPIAGHMIARVALQKGIKPIANPEEK